MKSPIMKFALLLYALTLYLCATLFTALAVELPAVKLNIIVIMADDLG
jgi:hypothetical protein